MRRVLRKYLLRIIAFAVIVYLFVPIAVIAVLSFNKPANRYNLTWNAFSLDAWKNICGFPGVCQSFVTSVQIGIISTVIATVMGTMIAIALVRYRFRGRGATNILIFLPMATPEVIMGFSLLALFIFLKFPPGFAAVTIAHIMFIISFAVVAVKARVQGLDPRLEEAARDLYANPLATFRYVTLPIILPGIVGAALLGFALSFDDFVISYFNAGTMQTFPIFIWGAAQRGIPVQVNALATLVFVVALLAVVIGQVLRSRRQRRVSPSR